MSVREAQQLATLLMSILTVVFSVVSIKTKPTKTMSHIVFGLYGLIGVFYYIVVIHGGAPGHVLSPTRSIIKDTLIATWLGLWLARDIWKIFNGNH